jgi:hypothetical protein
MISSTCVYRKETNHDTKSYILLWFVANLQLNLLSFTLYLHLCDVKDIGILNGYIGVLHSLVD